MKALANPTPGIALTTTLTLIMMGEKMSLDESKKEAMWKKSVNYMSNPD